jgi:hypothetical protein
MRKYLASLALLTLVAGAVSAQGTTLRPEIRPFVGMYVPTGHQRDMFKDAALFGVQAALEIEPSFHLLGTFGYVPGQTKLTSVGNDVQILAYDVGFEVDMVRSLGGAWLFKPFFGLGVGARTYMYDNVALRDRSCAAGYGALGMEFEINRAAIRLEGRDNVFCFRSPTTSPQPKTRNDVGFSLGLAYHFK